jgi:hypothetical protein
MRLMIALLAIGPSAYGISLWRIRRQRHAGGNRRGILSGQREWIANHFFVRTRPFRSAGHAAFWHEWKRSGFILPIGVGVVLAMTCLPAWLAGPLSGRGTIGVLAWVFVSPLILAMVLGCGYSKFDFWSADLSMPEFAAVRPLSPGRWVVIKLEVALASVAITWLLVLLISFLFVAYAGDLDGLNQLYRQLGFYYSSTERWLLLAWAFFAGVALSWRFLISGLAIGLSAKKGWFYASNSLRAAALTTLLFLVIWRSDRTDHPLHLYDLWPWIGRLPLLLALAVIAKVLCAAIAWIRVRRLHLLPPQTVGAYFAGWTAGTGLFAVGVSVAFPHTPWLRHSLILLSLLVLPLAGPALGMLALSRNRSRA